MLPVRPIYYFSSSHGTQNYSEGSAELTSAVRRGIKNLEHSLRKADLDGRRVRIDQGRAT